MYYEQRKLRIKSRVWFQCLRLGSEYERNAK